MEEANGMPNISGNFSVDKEITYHLIDYDRIFSELFTIVGLLALITNSLLVFTILKFKQLRNDTTNILLVHLNIVQATVLVVTPLTLRLNLVFQIFSTISRTVFCSIYEAELVLGCAIILFLTLLISDGHLKLYHDEIYKKFDKMYNFVVGAIYIFVICGCSISIHGCVQHYISYHLLAILFVVASFILFLIVMNIVHLVKKRNLTDSNKSTNLGLVISNIFVLLWIPLLLCFIFALFHRSHDPLVLISLCTFGFTSPVFNFFYLFRYHSNFYIFLRQVFKCQCNDYSNESLTEDPVVYDDKNGVTICVK